MPKTKSQLGQSHRGTHGLCIHCHRTKYIIRARGLCSYCYSDDSIKVKYRPLKAFYGTGPNAMLSGRDRPMPEPTDAIQGTREKIAVFQKRAIMGLELFHPLDGLRLRGA